MNLDCMMFAPGKLRRRVYYYFVYRSFSRQSFPVLETWARKVAIALRLHNLAKSFLLRRGRSIQPCIGKGSRYS